uniref:Transmembrane protein 204 n=1 Tax=Anthurium amnicola TaxID=1678845 RepID=A0A1D1YFG1_9ARAE
MPLTRLTADAFGVVTIALVSVFIILGLFCISYMVYFRHLIRKHGLLQLGYFHGPCLTRIALILVATWWCIGEIVRLRLLKGRGRLFSNLTWQKNVCKYYILSNIGFAEPCLFLILVFLLRASLHKRESGTLSRHWNGKTVRCVLLICLPMFILQLGLIFCGPKFLDKERNHGIKLASYFWNTSYLAEDSSICTYPLLSTAILGLCDVVLIGYVSYYGVRMVSSAINKVLRRRVCILIFSVIFFIPLRVILLGLTVLPSPVSLAFEALVFLAFLVLLLCTMVGVYLLVYYPVADSSALRCLVHLDFEEVPFDDYYCDGTSLTANQSQIETSRNSDASTKRGSISFRTLIKDESPAADASDDVGQFSPAALHIVSPSG